MANRVFGVLLLLVCLAGCAQPPASVIKWQSFSQDEFSVMVPTPMAPKRTQSVMKAPPPLADMTMVSYQFEGEDGTFQVQYCVLPVFSNQEGEKHFFDWINTGLRDGIVKNSPRHRLMYTEERMADGHPARLEAYEVAMEGETEKGEMKLLRVLAGNRLYFAIATTIPETVSPGARQRAEDFLKSLKFSKTRNTT